ncbi:DinB family protein [Winogradskyella sp. A3E31]|uniref:DinB family protein n=1 Tax=Winogradskyella sp. A3E31 TaxID=3349637 RepID=UPI00398A9DCF
MSYIPSDGFPYYFDLAGNMSCHKLFSSTSTFEFLESIDEKKATYRYARDKWSIKQVVGHITDHERIKMSRAHLLSRNETVNLWSYDQNALVENSRFDELTFKYMVYDFKNVRKASISFIEGLSEDQLKIKGKANDYEITLEDFLKSIIGHEIHHVNIIKEKYF